MSRYNCNRCGKPTDNDQSFKFHDGSTFEIHRCDECQKQFDRELAWESKGETINEKKIICPYCGYEYEDCFCYDYEEGMTEEEECASCGRKFDIEVEVYRTYSVKRSLSEMPEDFEDDDEC